VLLTGALLGLMIGSFMNVVIARVPKRESIIRPASHCPQCGSPIRAADNVPIVSWIVLGGRCRDCGRQISLRYPLVELAGGLIGLGIAALALSAS